jgi:Spy/CpxP family protein refolding chaperone
MRTCIARLKALVVIMLLITSAAAIAQPPGKNNDKEEKIEAMKIAFITKKLDLTPQEAQTFWPVYNEYSGKLDELRKKRHKEMRNARENVDELSDKELEALVDGEMTFRQKELDLQKEYHGKFKSVLPVKKVAKLYVAEEQFKRELLKIMKEPGQGPGGKGPR